MMPLFEAGIDILIVRKHQGPMALDLKAPQGHTNAFIFFCHVRDEETCLFLKIMIGNNWTESNHGE